MALTIAGMMGLSSCHSSDNSNDGLLYSQCGDLGKVLSTRAVIESYESGMQELQCPMKITREGNDLYCEVFNYVTGCGVNDMKINSSQKDGEIIVKVEKSFDEVSSNCVCTHCLYFTIHDVKQNDFVFKLDGYVTQKINMAGHNMVTAELRSGEVSYDKDLTQLTLRNYKFDRDDATGELAADKWQETGKQTTLSAWIDRSFYHTLNVQLKNYPIPADATQCELKASLDDNGALVVHVEHNGTSKSAVCLYTIDFQMVNVNADRYLLKLNPHKEGDKTVFDYEGNIVFNKEDGDKVEIKL